MAKNNVVRLNINVPSSLMQRLDDYADSMNINRTSAVAVLLTQALDNQKALNSLNSLSELIKVVDEQKISEQLKK